MSRGDFKQLFLFSAGLASLVAGCAPASTGDGNGEATRTQLSTGSEKLTAAEWSQYISNQQYIHSMVKPDQRVRLNMADPKQYAFAMARLKANGKTPENSPYLFEKIEERRKKHQAMGLKPGTFADPGVKSSSIVRSEQHRIDGAGFAYVGTNGVNATQPNNLHTTASSTYPEGALYTWLDISVTTTAGQEIAPFAYHEEFEPPAPDQRLGARVISSTEGNPLLGSVKRYAISSFKYEDIPGEFTDSYIYTEVGKKAQFGVANIPLLDGPVIVRAPVDAPTSLDGITHICLQRFWPDCDVISGPTLTVKVPLDGTVRLQPPFVFDDLQINQIADKIRDGIATPYEGAMSLVLANVGGGCDVVGNALRPKMEQFWRSVTFSPTKNEMSWNLTGNNIAVFDESCRQYQDRSELTLAIKVPVKDPLTNDPSEIEFTVTSDVNFPRPEGPINPIKITNSCLAEGTVVELARGKAAKIESLKSGQAVANPFDLDDRALTIMDTAIGTESTPMVRIRDGQGRTLLMTEMHPISTPDRGMVQARHLKVGDKVMTKDGAAELTEVSREAYAGKVHNLKVGSKAEMAKLIEDQTVFYANGFLVGDGQIQSKYESLDLRAPGVGVADQWRRDYQLSQAASK